MKLELKHLSPYLPYELKAVIRLREDSSLPIDDECVVTVSCFEVAYLDSEYEEFKPILRPLSDFKGMIVRDIKIELELSHNQVMEFFGFMDGEIKLDNITLGLYNAMCKKYIDFNGLIEKKLAIDINTLNN